jgi:hypothetical protein
MESVHDDRYLVFLRYDSYHAQSNEMTDTVERPLASCASYGEARRIRDALHGSGAGECVIRYVGPAGGGD